MPSDHRPTRWRADEGCAGRQARASLPHLSSVSWHSPRLILHLECKINAAEIIKCMQVRENLLRHVTFEGMPGHGFADDTDC
jgi:hypothetical protein